MNRFTTKYAMGIRLRRFVAFVLCIALTAIIVHADENTSYQVFQPKDGASVTGRYIFVVKGDAEAKPGTLQIATDATFEDIRYNGNGWIAVEDWWQQDVDLDLVGNGLWYWRISGVGTQHTMTVEGAGEASWCPREDAIYENIQLPDMDPGTSLTLNNIWLRTAGDSFSEDEYDFIADENTEGRVNYSFLVQDGYLLLPKFKETYTTDYSDKQQVRIINSSTGRQVKLETIPYPDYYGTASSSMHRRFDEIGTDDAGHLYLMAAHNWGTTSDDSDFTSALHRDKMGDYRLNIGSEELYSKNDNTGLQMHLNYLTFDAENLTFASPRSIYMNFLFPEQPTFLVNSNGSVSTYDYPTDKSERDIVCSASIKGDIFGEFSLYVKHFFRVKPSATEKSMKLYGWRLSYTNSNANANTTAVRICNRYFVSETSDSLVADNGPVQFLDDRTFLTNSRNYGSQNLVNDGKYKPVMLCRLADYDADDYSTKTLKIKQMYELPKASLNPRRGGCAARWFKFDGDFYILEASTWEFPLSTTASFTPTEAQQSERVKFTLHRVKMPDFSETTNITSTGRIMLESEELWSFPQADYAPKRNNAYLTNTSVYVDTISSRDHADLYIYAPGVYMGAYRLQKSQTTSVKNVSVDSDLKWQLKDGQLSLRGSQDLSDRLEIYSSDGRLVAVTKLGENTEQGYNELRYDTKQLTRGVYIARYGSVRYKFVK